MQELAGKHPQSLSKRLEAAGVGFLLHLYLFMSRAAAAWNPRIEEREGEGEEDYSLCSGFVFVF